MVEEDQGETEERSLNWKSEELSSSQGEGEATGKEGGWAEFHLITAIPSGLDSSSLWTALGFSPNSKMVCIQGFIQRRGEDPPQIEICPPPPNQFLKNLFHTGILDRGETMHVGMLV